MSEPAPPITFGPPDSGIGHGGVGNSRRDGGPIGPRQPPLSADSVAVYADGRLVGRFVRSVPVDILTGSVVQVRAEPTDYIVTFTVRLASETEENERTKNAP